MNFYHQQMINIKNKINQKHKEIDWIIYNLNINLKQKA